MEGRKLVVVRFYEVHKVLFYHVRIRAAQRTFKVCVNNSLFCNFFLKIVVNEFRVILCADTGKACAFSLWNSKFFECVLNVLGNIFPLALHFCVRADIGCNVFDVKSRNIRSPLRFFKFVVNFKRIQTELAHPFRVVFVPGKLFNNFRSKAGLVAVKSFFFVLKVVGRGIYV